MKNGVNQVNFALYYKSRVKATCELPEEKRPKPLTTASQALLNEASLAVTNLDPDIPSQSHKIKLATHILAGAGLLDSVDLILAQVVHLPTTRKGALIIAVPELKKFALPGPFGGRTSHTRALIHGTSFTASASCWKDSSVLQIGRTIRISNIANFQSSEPILWGQRLPDLTLHSPYTLLWIYGQGLKEGERTASSAHWSPLSKQTCPPELECRRYRLGSVEDPFGGSRHHVREAHFDAQS